MDFFYPGPLPSPTKKNIPLDVLAAPERELIDIIAKEEHPVTVIFGIDGKLLGIELYKPGGILHTPGPWERIEKEVKDKTGLTAKFHPYINYPWITFENNS